MSPLKQNAQTLPQLEGTKPKREKRPLPPKLKCLDNISMAQNSALSRDRAMKVQASHHPTGKSIPQTAGSSPQTENHPICLLVLTFRKQKAN